MVRSLKLFVPLLLVLIFISGCSTVYVCGDGSTQRKLEDCPIIEQPRIIQRQAENAVDLYSQAYSLSLGSRPSRINTYAEGPDWVSEVLFSSVQSGEIYRVKLRIDGRTSSVSCLEGCAYLLRAELSEDLGEEVFDDNVSENVFD